MIFYPSVHRCTLGGFKAYQTALRDARGLSDSTSSNPRPYLMSFDTSVLICGNRGLGGLQGGGLLQGGGRHWGRADSVAESGAGVGLPGRGRLRGGVRLLGSGKLCFLKANIL